MDAPFTELRMHLIKFSLYCYCLVATPNPRYTGSHYLSYQLFVQRFYKGIQFISGAGHFDGVCKLCY